MFPESPKRKEGEPDYKPVSLVTLGFKGAGATSWRHALEHYLEYSFLIGKSNFAFTFKDPDGKIILTDKSPLPPQPTSITESHTYRLQCQPKKEVIPNPSPLAVWDSREKKMKRNERRYLLNFQDIPSPRTRPLLTGGQSNAPEIENLMTNADRVLYFISLIPPIGMDSSDNDTAQAKALDILRKLIKKPQSLCVCLTNIDRVDVPIRTTRNLYGLGEVAKVIEENDLLFFPMTSVGYQPRDFLNHTMGPNYDHSTRGVLFGGTDWKPEGVARPLFRLFSSLEIRDKSLTQLQYPE